MLLSKEQRIEKAVSKDEIRPAMQNILLDNGNLIATNGHIMAIVPADDSADDTNGLISLEAVKLARKTPNGIILLNGSQEIPEIKAKLDRPQLKYPEYLDVIPTEKETVRFTINPQLLMDLADALGSKKKLTLEYISPKKAIRVMADDGFGLIMPINPDSITKSNYIYNSILPKTEIKRKIEAEIRFLDSLQAKSKAKKIKKIGAL